MSEPDILPTPNSPDAVADTAMATGLGDDEPDMTIAEKHTGEPVPDPDGNGTLTTEEAAELLGATDTQSNGDNQS